MPHKPWAESEVIALVKMAEAGPVVARDAAKILGRTLKGVYKKLRRLELPIKPPPKPWKDAELDKLRAVWSMDGINNIEGISKLVGRSPRTVRRMAKGIGLPLVPQLQIEGWTKGQDEELRALWVQDGYRSSPQAIAVKLGRSSHVVYRRARRLGLPLRPAARPWEPHEIQIVRNMWLLTSSPGPIANALGRTKDAVYRKATDDLGLPPQGKRPKIQPSPPHPLATLGKRDCHFPIGDPKHAEFRYCGAHVDVEDKSYCNDHLSIAYRPLPRKNEDVPSA